MNTPLIKIRDELLHQSKKSYFYKLAWQYLDKQKLVLDIGCGYGNFIKLQTKNTVGLDRNIANLSKLKSEYPQSTIVNGDALMLPFVDRSFDGIHCSHILEHFEPASVHSILREIDRLLSKGGILVISSPLLWEGFYDDLTHDRPYSPTSILHYYADVFHSRSMPRISSSYEVVALKYRYYAKKIDPVITSWRFINYLCIFFTKLLTHLGVRKWVKNGYMLVLRKASS